MLWLVSFDISDDKSRRGAVKLLEGFGERVQYSVFECMLGRARLRQLQTKMERLIAPTDKVLYYPLCGKDVLQRQADGAGKVVYPAPLHLIDE